jgi:hypothetical protein
MRSMVEGASAVPLALHQIILSAARPLHRARARSPSPASFHCAGADKRERSRGASAPEFLLTTKEQRGRRSAERRMPSMVRAIPATSLSPTSPRTRAKRGALAFRRFAADSPRQSQPALAQPQTVFPGTWLQRVSPAFACPSPARSAQTGPCAGPTVTRAARERTANPRAGTALAPHSGVPSRRRPSMSEIRY